jgi:cytochrome c-type biogenesis protein CcmF
VVIGGSLLLFALRAPVRAATGIFAPVSREGALVLNNILLCSICAVVLTGTTYPLFAELVFGAKLSVGPPYFQSTVFPLAIPLFLAMSLGPVLPWKRAELWPALFKLWWAALIAAAVGVVAALGLRYGLASLGFAASAWLICGAFAEVVERTRLFRAPFATFRTRVAAQPLSVGVRRSRIRAWASPLPASLACRSRPAHRHDQSTGQSVRLAGYDWTLLGCTMRGGRTTRRASPISASPAAGGKVVTFNPSHRVAVKGGD